MPPLSRTRLTLQQKQKIIEESKKPGFKREKVINEYGINKGTLSVLHLQVLGETSEFFL